MCEVVTDKLILTLAKTPKKVEQECNELPYHHTTTAYQDLRIGRRCAFDVIQLATECKFKAHRVGICAARVTPPIGIAQS